MGWRALVIFGVIVVVTINTIGATPNPIPATQPSPKTYTLPGDVTDAQIADSIDKGVKFLRSAFKNGQVAIHGQISPAASWGGAYSVEGVDALCVYALLHSGQSVDEDWLKPQAPFTRQIIETLKRYDLSFTYHRSLRAAALAVYNRKEDFGQLQDDVSWLVRASQRGAYTYKMPVATVVGGEIWDNSNSQYGVLGVWSGADAGVHVPKDYWEEVDGHWRDTQSADGRWAYLSARGTNTGTLPMSEAGAASLLVTREYLDESADDPSAVPSVPSAPLAKALKWFETGDNAFSDMGQWPAYTLYGLERVGLASGFKYFGKHDWYAQYAKSALAKQRPSGAWGADPPNLDTLIDTSYVLLFLSRGRHPVLFNKLQFDGSWGNHPHDLKNLARFASHELERPLNWQVVNLQRDWHDWMDSPILYIASDDALELTDDEYQKLADFAYGGGLIFTHADGSSETFNKWVNRLVAKIFPKLELRPLPPAHPIYSMLYRFKDSAPRLLSVSNGSRPLLVHSPEDLSSNWQLNQTDAAKPAMKLGVNLFVFATGKRDLRHRLESPYIPECPQKPGGQIRVARLRYGGDWNPEPYAWQRFARYFQWETNSSVAVSEIDLRTLKPTDSPVAVLTGTTKYNFTDAEITSAQAFVRSGGVLVVDACGGNEAFKTSIEGNLFPRAFPGAKPAAITMESLPQPILRPYTIEKLGAGIGLQTMSFGNGVIIYSPIDLTTGLLGTNTWGILGFDPAYSAALMKNIVLWSSTRSK